MRPDGYFIISHRNVYAARASNLQVLKESPHRCEIPYQPGGRVIDRFQEFLEMSVDAVPGHRVEQFRYLVRVEV